MLLLHTFLPIGFGAGKIQSAKAREQKKQQHSNETTKNNKQNTPDAVFDSKCMNKYVYVCVCLSVFNDRVLALRESPVECTATNCTHKSK